MMKDGPQIKMVKCSNKDLKITPTTKKDRIGISNNNKNLGKCNNRGFLLNKNVSNSSHCHLE
jgi:hypothetical protein